MVPLADGRILVFRVEHPEDRLGPYTSKNYMGCDFGAQTPEHPLPHNDGIPMCPFPTCDWCTFHGFESLVALAKWFPAMDRVLLKGKGFQLVIYEVAPEFVVTGRRQLVFQRPGHQNPVLMFDLGTDVCDIQRAVLEHRCNVAAGNHTNPVMAA